MSDWSLDAVINKKPSLSITDIKAEIYGAASKFGRVLSIKHLHDHKRKEDVFIIEFTDRQATANAAMKLDGIVFGYSTVILKVSKSYERCT